MTTTRAMPINELPTFLPHIVSLVWWWIVLFGVSLGMWCGGVYKLMQMHRAMCTGSSVKLDFFNPHMWAHLISLRNAFALLTDRKNTRFSDALSHVIMGCVDMGWGMSACDKACNSNAGLARLPRAISILALGNYLQKSDLSQNR